jgi:hypothetical protein
VLPCRVEVAAAGVVVNDVAAAPAARVVPLAIVSNAIVPAREIVLIV